MTQVIQQNNKVALLRQRVPDTGKGRAGIEAVGGQFPCTVIEQRAVPSRQLAFAEALRPYYIQDGVDGKSLPLKQ